MKRTSSLSIASGIILSLLLSGCAYDNPISLVSSLIPGDDTVSEKASATTIDNKQAEAPSIENKATDNQATASALQTQPDTSTIPVTSGQRGETINVGLVSWRDIPFRTVQHQAFDYSCGSAAVATLMTYIYGIKTSEKEVFDEMFAKGDQDKIRHEGFSMLDMSTYLNNHGLQAKGYQITQNVVEKYRIPVIALVSNNGYNHFVVIKTMKNGRILVGDPNTGNTEYSREDFGKIWAGVALVVTNEGSKAHAAFENQNEWHNARAHVDLRNGVDPAVQGTQLQPMQWQLAPAISDILPITKVGTTASGLAGSGL